MTPSNSMPEELGDDLLRQERANARRYHRQYMAHPDPRDPDHPELPEDEVTEERCEACDSMWGPM